MRFYRLLLLLILSAIAAFIMLNWSVFITPTDLSFGITTAKMPLGLIMVVLLVFITIVFLVYVLYLQSSTLIETRRHSRELKANRDLADQAEASRFTELRNFLEAEMLKQANLSTEYKSMVLAGIEKLEQNLYTTIEQSNNTIAAYIGELDDRIDKNKNSI